MWAGQPAPDEVELAVASGNFSCVRSQSCEVLWKHNANCLNGPRIHFPRSVRSPLAVGATPLQRNRHVRTGRSALVPAHSRGCSSGQRWILTPMCVNVSGKLRSCDGNDLYIYCHFTRASLPALVPTSVRLRFCENARLRTTSPAPVSETELKQRDWDKGRLLSGCLHCVPLRWLALSHSVCLK